MQFNFLRARQQPRPDAQLGLVVALVSAAAFATSGVFGKALFGAGWSPTAAITARIGIAALALAVPTVLALRGRWRLVRRNLATILLYGATGVAGCQLLYFLAIERLSVGVGLLLEYLAPVLLVLLTWATTRRAPRLVTVAGALAAVAGLALVLDLLGGVRIDPVGVAYGLGAAACLAAYFLVAARAHDDALPPLALAGLGMVVGFVALLVVGASGILPMRASSSDAVLAGHSVNVLVPLLGMGVLAAAFAYWSGAVSARLLGARLASFVALAEVLFAVLFAWLVLDEQLHGIQLAGGVLVILGVVLVRLGEREAPASAAAAPAARAPEAVS